MHYIPKAAAVFLVYLFSVLITNSVNAGETYTLNAIWPQSKQLWYFKQPKGMAVDKEGYLYIADSWNDRIQKFSADGSFITTWGKLGDEQGEFNQPYDVAIDDEGFVYITDSQNERVQKFSPEGKFVSAWDNSKYSTDLFNLPTGIAIDFRDDVYVVDTNADQIHKFDKTGQYLFSWGQTGTGVGDFHHPRGIAAGEKGHIYVADEGNNRIQKFTSSGEFVMMWGVTGNGDGEFNLPNAVTVGNSGAVYVTDRKNHRIQKFTPDGVFLSSWGGYGEESGLFFEPGGISSDTDGTTFVSDTKNDRIQRFDEQGNFLGQFGRGETNSPDGIALGNDGNIYLADTDNHRILKLNADLQAIDEWGKGGISREPGGFNYPHRIVVNNEGDVYVSDTFNHRIQQFSSQGVFQQEWGIFGGNIGEFSFPMGIAVDSGGNIFVADKGNNRIQIIDPIGKFSVLDIENNDEEVTLNEPEGVDVNEAGEVYVADKNNHCIKKFTRDGNLIQKWGSMGSGDLEFLYPGNISVNTEDGVVYLYATDTENHRIQKFTEDGELIAIIGERGSFHGQFKYPGQTSIGFNGELYVADSYNHRFQFFQKSADALNAKAIVIAGGGPFPGNKLWDATRLSANFAYYALNFRGLPKNQVRYLSEDNIDLDNNDSLDDVYGPPTIDNIKDAMDWGADADQLTIYLVDHGGADAFRLSETETITPTEINEWLKLTEGAKEIIFIYDACNSGLFVDNIDSLFNNAIVIASTSFNKRENAHFINQGSLSFSAFFWSSIFSGDTVDSAFTEARKGVGSFTEYQTPFLREYGMAAETTIIGNDNTIKTGKPEINIYPGSYDPETNSLPLSVNIEYNRKIIRCWALVIPKMSAYQLDETTYLEFPSFELMGTGAATYEGKIKNLAGGDEHLVSVFARDIFGNTFTAMPSIIPDSSDKRSKALLVAGSSDSDNRNELIQQVMSLAQMSLSIQGYDNEDIYTVTSDDPEDLADILNGWDSINTSNALLFLAGEVENNQFQMGPENTVYINDLDIWLDDLQHRISGEVIVILDAPNSNNCLPLMLPPGKNNRILIVNSPSIDNLPNRTSFSWQFWSQILSGNSVWNAYSSAENSIRFFYPTQNNLLLDDNGNGIGDDLEDGRFSMNVRIGNGIGITRNPPQITEAESEKMVLNGASSALLWIKANAISDIDSAWAVISPPYSDNDTNSATTDRIELYRTNDRYQSEYDQFIHFGDYKIAFYASDVYGNVSMAKELTLFQSKGKDVYEPDDQPLTARNFAINGQPQYHNIHSGSGPRMDQDWLQFFGFTGNTYELIAKDRLGNCIPGIEIEIYSPDILIDPTATPLVTGSCSVSWPCNDDGVYYAKITSEKEQSYFVDIYLPTAMLPGYLIGRVVDSLGEPISGAVVKTDGEFSGRSFKDGHYVIIHQPGDYYITATIEGNVIAIEDAVHISEAGTTVQNIVVENKNPDPNSPMISMHDLPDPVVGHSTELIFEVRSGNGPYILTLTIQNDSGILLSQKKAVGEMETLKIPITFDQHGNHDIEITAIDRKGKTSPKFRHSFYVQETAFSIEINPENIGVNRSGKLELIEDDSIIFSAEIKGGYGDYVCTWRSEALFYERTYNHNPSSPESIQIEFDKAGYYELNLHVVDGKGNMAEDSVGINVTKAISPSNGSPDGSCFIKTCSR